MRVRLVVLLGVMLLLAGCAGSRPKGAAGSGPVRDVAAPTVQEGDAPAEETGEVRPIPDPLEPVNRAFFHFNDKLYFWVFKPVSQGYGWLVPRPARRGVRNFFSNLATPVRTVNCLLQGDLKGTGTELGRFGINTTLGVLGFGDPARGWWDIRRRNEDFGQTLGVYGLGPGIYFNWPIFGPSSLPRGTVGMVADAALDPATYVPGLTIYERVNSTSLQLGDYEDLKEAALDAYLALRNAYHQNRQHLVKQRGP